ncbi:uncharacterized protein Smp_203670 [Schistosoma mansoni]|uniref:uncharacterized protein n=1 Tax=Schistosoma mansoni TaxID=6183 RepID=UPI00022DC98C|nr:uncharacterized protein Smp_203670 [Schistosoma mansoni]|eukprot:XP_018654829.1 uncharacterized protein Smp_203670 [Schistosoma mansoni]
MRHVDNLKLTLKNSIICLLVILSYISEYLQLVAFPILIKLYEFPVSKYRLYTKLPFAQCCSETYFAFFS